MNAILDRFQLPALGTTVRTEVLAGLTTWLAMAYIVAVNPAILGEAGMDRGAVFTATCLAAGIASILMGLLANYPLALAPGMGLNAYFAFAVVLGMKVPWQVALGIFGLTLVLPTDYAPPARTGVAAGMMLMIGYLGSATGPLIGGVVRDLTGSFSGALLVLPVISVTLVAGALILPRRRDFSAAT